jgi:3-phenylpropionate/cinnamic acid dioxygenase small subunit
MSDIEARLARLESRFAIQDLMYRYAECVDLARFDELGALFAHGSLGADGADAPMRGASQIGKFYAATNKVHSDGTLRTRHLASNAIVEVDPTGRRASARSYFVVLQATAAVPLQPIVAGRYHDRFHVVDGNWCFEDRLIFVDQIGNMTDHLSFDLRRDPIPKVAG